MNTLPPGLRGLLAQRQMAQQEQQGQLGQIQGLLGIQQAQMQQGLLSQQMAERENQRARLEAFANTLPESERPAFMIDPTGYMKNNAPMYKDLGGSIGIVRNGQLVGTLPKSASPDAVLNNEGQNLRHTTPSGSSILGAQTTMRGQDLNHQLGLGNLAVSRGNLDLSRQRLAFDQSRPTGSFDAARGVWVSGGVATPVIDSTTGKPLGEKSKSDVDSTLNLYVAARDGLISGLNQASTGPVAGRMPAVTTASQTAEGGVAAMAPVLKQLFRVAGEGTFTDKDQQLLLEMVPKRTDTPAARAAKIQNIDNIISAKLGRSVPRFGNQGGSVFEQADAIINGR